MIGIKIFMSIVSMVIALLPEFKVDVIVPEVGDNIINIFAWVCRLLPMGVIGVLLAMTAMYYTFKFTFRVFKYVLSLFGLG